MIGGWRDHYRSLGAGTRSTVVRGRHARCRSLQAGPTRRCLGRAARRRARSRTSDEFKQLLLPDKAGLARALTESSWPTRTAAAWASSDHPRDRRGSAGYRRGHRLRFPDADSRNRPEPDVPGSLSRGLSMSAESISRRTFLRASGVALGLPLLDAMTPAFARSAAPKRRMVAINTGPRAPPAPSRSRPPAGRAYELTPYLDVFKDVSGRLHRHFRRCRIRTSTADTWPRSRSSPRPPIRAARASGTSISLDQLAAEKIGLETRFGFLTLSTAGRGLSWTRSGVEIPTERRPSQLFAKLFLEGKADEKARQAQAAQGRPERARRRERQTGGSSASSARRTGKSSRSTWAPSGRPRSASLKAEAWEEAEAEDRGPAAEGSADRLDILEHQRLIYGLMHLALQTDSTRIIPSSRPA